MFCSNCGKTIRPDEAACPHCGASMGEGRFNGTMYTSVQARIPVDDLKRAPSGSVAFTRTDYMSEEGQPQPDVYSNTTYRPLLSAQEDQSRQAPAAPQPQQPAPGDVPEAEDLPAPAAAAVPQDGQAPAPDEVSSPAQDEFYTEEGAQAPAQAPAAGSADAQYEEGPAMRHVPLPRVEEGSINPEIEQFMAEFSQRQARDAEKRQSGGSRFKMPSFLSRRQNAQQPAEEDVPDAVDVDGTPVPQPEQPAPETEAETEACEAEDTAAYEQQSAAPAAPVNPPAEGEDTGAYEGEDEYEGEGEEEYEDEEGERPANPLSRALSAVKNTLANNKVVRYAIAALLILAVVVCGVIWLVYVTAARSKIAGVTYSTYSKGVEMIQTYATAQYRDDFNGTYAVNSTYARNKLADDAAALTALVPEEPMENDEAFVSALKDMQSVIADTLLLDAAAAKDGTTEERQAASESEWTIIEGSIARLTSATSISELTGVTNMIGSAAQPTPTPAPTPSPEIYATLSKGMMDSRGVQTMQERLIELGYLTGTADGDFGKKTEDALKEFQRQAGLSVDGIATSAVQEALYEEDAPANPNAPTPTPEPEGEGEPDQGAPES